jgi:hypothetical protein
LGAKEIERTLPQLAERVDGVFEEIAERWHL